MNINLIALSSSISPFVVFFRCLGMLAIFFFLSGCEGFVDIGVPKSELVTESVFGTETAAVSAISGIYAEIAGASGFASGGPSSIMIYAGCSADEFDAVNTSLFKFWNNQLSKLDADVKQNIWSAGYQYIYYANSVLEGIDMSTGLSNEVKLRLSAEARFIRAFCYFYLVNLFGDVPLVLTTDYRVSAKSGRSSIPVVYSAILDDLLFAKENLPVDYSSSLIGRVRPNKSAASALLARIYLYSEDWQNATIESSNVIDNELYAFEEEIDNIFLISSREAILQLAAVDPGINSREGSVFDWNYTPYYVSLNDELVGAFEEGDRRLGKWVKMINEGDATYYLPNKYKAGYGASSLTEYSMILRLSEQYLIRAEARAKKGDLSGSIVDLDRLRGRAGLPLIADTNPEILESDLLANIANERRIELFSEWGHRWFDLKRTQSADEVLSMEKNNWESTDVLYPIPQLDIDLNPNLLPQNEGY